MLFNSLEFILLVSLTMGFYYTGILRPAQRFILIFASFVFYASNQPILLLLLLFSIAINTVTSYFVHHGPHEHKRAIASLGVASNLGVLAFFKYGPLFGNSLFQESNSIGEFLVSIPLPIGISFFTFQGITLLVDTFRAEEHPSKLTLIPQKSFREHAINTCLYIGFFPQLVAGPIVKAHEFFPQIVPKFLIDVDWLYCFRHLVTGYFFKMVVADSLKDQTFWISYPAFESLGSTTLLVMLFGYSMQIFADFAGYSLIAIGVAGLYGYRLPINFNFPYIARSFSEFWQRWHISLSSFLKEYLYIPLGGNRKGRLRTYANLMIVMLLGGLWHGAAWSYMVWGGFHGLALATERFLSARMSLPDSFLFSTIRIILVFSFVTIAWLLFKLPEFSQVILYVKAVTTNVDRGESLDIISSIAIYSLPVIIYHAHYLVREFYGVTDQQWAMPFAYGFMLFLIITNSASPEAFVYFQF